MVDLAIKDDVAHIVAQSNILIDDVDIFEAKVAEAFDAEPAAYIFDFDGVEYMCSAALGVIANLLKNVMTNDGVIYFVGLTDRLRETFDATQFTAIVKVAESVSQAEKAIRA